MTMAIITTNQSVNTPVSGIGAGDSVAMLYLAWILIGTDDAGHTDLTNQANLTYAAETALAAGRGTTIADSGNIASVQTTAGLTISVGTLVQGATYVPAVKVMETMSGGGQQTGNWSKGPAITYNGTTTTTTAAPGAWLLSATALTSGAGSAVVGSSDITLSSSSTSAALAFFPPQTRAQNCTYKLRFSAGNTSEDSWIFELGYKQPAIGTVAAVTDAATGWRSGCGLSLFTSGGNLYCRALFNSIAIGNISAIWLTSASWSTTADFNSMGFFPLTPGADYVAVIITTATGVSFALRSADESTTIFQTTEKAWTDLQNLATAGTSTVYPWSGDAYTNAHATSALVLKNYTVLSYGL